MHELSFPTFQELEDGREPEILKRTPYNKVYIWSSRREIRHETQTVIFLNLFSSKIWDGSISASEYEDNPLNRQEIAVISKHNILNFPFFITIHYLILIKKLWRQTVENIPFTFPQIASWVLFFFPFFVFEKWGSSSDFPGFNISGECHSACVWLHLPRVFILGVFSSSQTFITAEFKVGIPKWI